MAGGIQNYIDCIVPQVGLAVIVDTGSSDNTVSILRCNAERYSHLHIFETPFETFATTRNQSMDFALGLASKYPAITHLLLLDADERICGDQMLFFAQVAQKIAVSHEQKDTPLKYGGENDRSLAFHGSCVKFKALNVDPDGSPSSRKNAGLMNPRLFPFDHRFRFRDMVQEKRFERLMFQTQEQEQPTPLTSDGVEKRGEKEIDCGLIPVPKEMYFETKIWADSILAKSDSTKSSCFAVREITFAHYVPPTNQRVKKNKKYQGEEMSAALEETRHKSSMKASVGKEALIRVKWALQRHIQRLARALWKENVPSLREEEYILRLIWDNTFSASHIQKLPLPQNSTFPHGIDGKTEECKNDKNEKMLVSSEKPWYGLEARLSNFGLISCFNVQNSHFSLAVTEPLVDLDSHSNISGSPELLDPAYEYSIRWQDDLCLAILFRFLKKQTPSPVPFEFSAVDICGSRLVNEHLRSMLTSSLGQTNLSSYTSSDVCAISLPITPLQTQKDHSRGKNSHPVTLEMRSDQQVSKHDEHKTSTTRYISIVKALLNTNGMTIDMFASFTDAKSFAGDIIRGIIQVTRLPNFDLTFEQIISQHADDLFETISYICSLGQKLIAVVYASIPQTVFVTQVNLSPQSKQISGNIPHAEVVITLVGTFSPSRDYKDYLMKTQNETLTSDEKSLSCPTSAHTSEHALVYHSLTLTSKFCLEERVLDKDDMSMSYGLLSLSHDFHVESSVAKATNEAKNYLARLDFRKKQKANNLDVDDANHSPMSQASQAMSPISFRAQYNISAVLQRAFESTTNSSSWACSSIGRCFDIIAVSSPMNAICASMVMILTADGTVWLYDTPI